MVSHQGSTAYSTQIGDWSDSQLKAVLLTAGYVSAHFLLLPLVEAEAGAVFVEWQPQGPPRVSGRMSRHTRSFPELPGDQRSKVVPVNLCYLFEGGSWRPASRVVCPCSGEGFSSKIVGVWAAQTAMFLVAVAVAVVLVLVG